MKKKIFKALITLTAFALTLGAKGKTNAAEQKFYYGADISTFETQIQNGAKYYDFDGNELGDLEFFKFLYDNGVNSVRIRVWNDPYDENGNGYGGGNCDIENAKIIGELATKAGMSVLIDFHYSDFWADPSKQFVPKAWKDMTFDEKENALYEYTRDSLKYLIDNNVNVEMAQVGNETTTSGMCGETNWNNVCRLFNAGAKGIREAGNDIKVVLHFANPEKKGKYAEIAKTLETNNVDYDVFATSYYPYWHGTIENLTEVLNNISNTYGKKVMVAETSWAYTLDDGDGSGNTVSESNNSTNMPYTFDVVGQQAAIAAVTRAVEAMDAGIGIYYWENAWTPVDRECWEKGAGWATSFAADYDPNDAGKYYGGSAVDNQAWFDFNGHPLETVKIYNDIKEGKTFDEGVLEVETVSAKEVQDNLLINNGFEAGKIDGWEKGEGSNGGVTHDDPLSGDYTYHYWANSKFNLYVTQKLTVDAGLYSFGGYLQGSVKEASEDYQIFVIVNDKKYYAKVNPNGWVVWQNPEITNVPVSESQEVTVGFEGKCVAGAWGTWDDFYFVKTGEYSEDFEGKGDYTMLGEESSVEAEETAKLEETVKEEAPAEEEIDAETVASQKGFMSGQYFGLAVVILMAIILTLATRQLKKDNKK